MVTIIYGVCISKVVEKGQLAIYAIYISVWGVQNTWLFNAHFSVSILGYNVQNW